PRRPVRGLEMAEGGHGRLRDEAAPEAPEAALTVGERGHRTPFASATNRHTLSGSLRPGSASTPELTSTAYGRAVATARATFSGVRPAERMIRHCWLPSSRATVHSIGWRGSPSLQRAALSSRSAAVHLRYRSVTTRFNTGRPPSSPNGASLIVLMTGNG